MAKLIHFEQSGLTTAHARQKIASLEKNPFDGCCLRVELKGKDKQPNFSHVGEVCWRRALIDPSTWKDALHDLTTTPFDRFTDIFLQFHSAEHGLLPDDESAFAQVIENARQMAILARDANQQGMSKGRVKGIFFDNEGGPGGEKDKEWLWDARGRDWDKIAKKTMHAGWRFMDTIQREFPGVVIVTPFLHSNYYLFFQKFPRDGKPTKLNDSLESLRYPFMSGMIAAAKGDSKIIDALEWGYRGIVGIDKLVKGERLANGNRASSWYDLTLKSSMSDFNPHLDFEYMSQVVKQKMIEEPVIEPLVESYSDMISTKDLIKQYHEHVRLGYGLSIAQTHTGRWCGTDGSLDETRDITRHNYFSPVELELYVRSAMNSADADSYVWVWDSVVNLMWWNSYPQDDWTIPGNPLSAYWDGEKHLLPKGDWPGDCERYRLPDSYVSAVRTAWRQHRQATGWNTISNIPLKQSPVTLWRPPEGVYQVIIKIHGGMDQHAIDDYKAVMTVTVPQNASNSETFDVTDFHESWVGKATGFSPKFFVRNGGDMRPPSFVMDQKGATPASSFKLAQDNFPLIQLAYRNLETG